MSSLHATEKSFARLVFCAVLVGACAALYLWVKGPTIWADEVRVYRRSTSEKVDSQPLFRLQGDEAQHAASNFVYSSGGPYFECLNSDGWFRVVFIDKGHPPKSFDLYIYNGQIQPKSDSEPVAHLSSSSRDYWEKLIQSHS